MYFVQKEFQTCVPCLHNSEIFIVETETSKLARWASPPHSEHEKVGTSPIAQWIIPEGLFFCNKKSSLLDSI